MPKKKRSKRRRRAGQFLQNYLSKNGDTPVNVLLIEAALLHLNRDDLKNAKKDLGIRTRAERDPKTGLPRMWWWSLPEAATAPIDPEPPSPPWTPDADDPDFWYFTDPTTGERKLTHALGDEYARDVLSGTLPPPPKRKTRGDRLARLEMFSENFGHLYHRK